MGSWKTKTYIIGSVAGLLLGILAAFLFIRRAETDQVKPKINTNQGVKVGMSLLNVLRSIADLGSGS
ncbi:MAG: hypothetical protein HGB14_12540 [Anaerolineaceae bacterium]|nr:hypothetical protein [Anaerolineaceae bacterium]